LGSGEIANMRRGAIFPVKLFNELSKEDYPMLKKFALATIATMALSIATPALASDYLANTKSGKFHFADCRTIKHPDAPHFVPYDSRDEAIADGYKPCGVCEP
jgi:prophage lambdaCh01, nuclease domain protein